MLLALLVLGARDLRAQAYGPYFGPYGDVQYQQYLQYQHYLQWQQYLAYLQQTDPYYDLHVMHYQLYLQPYQPFQLYQPCCYGWGFAGPQWSTRIGPQPRSAIGPRSQMLISPRSPSAVSPMPRAARRR